LGELSLTNLTSVGFDTKMYPRVLGEVGAVGECLVARCTLVRLRFSHMYLRVELQIRLTCKNLGAHLALVFSDGCLARRMVGVGGLEGVSQVGLGEHLGPVDGLRNQNRATGRR